MKLGHILLGGLIVAASSSTLLSHVAFAQNAAQPSPSIAATPSQGNNGAAPGAIGQGIVGQGMVGQGSIGPSETFSGSTPSSSSTYYQGGNSPQTGAPAVQGAPATTTQQKKPEPASSAAPSKPSSNSNPFQAAPASSGSGSGTFGAGR